MAKMGRPKTENPVSRFVNVRMTEERYNRLKAYADLYNQTVAETVRKAVDEFLDKEESMAK
ncbi:MAG: CopG family transcriptional regulator [Eubacterium sp.]|nr:CopG family transcriptional regulator [Eubacterium sp.]